MILNGACISISNLPENIAWQTQKDALRSEARGPLKSGAWGGRPTCHPQKAPLFRAVYEYNSFQRFDTKTKWGTAICPFCYLWSAEWQVEEDSVLMFIHSFLCHERDVYFETGPFCSEYSLCVIVIDTSSFVSLYFNWTIFDFRCGYSLHKVIESNILRLWKTAENKPGLSIVWLRF